ncbi:sodium/proton antiporter NhaA [Helicobacter pullorum]|uniref:Na(+)/H(+) antiporter NhaA n=1 Tax=Helicobacter pullorum TaxID=35818 RepID=A0AAW3J581_9HELI|nr:sodium/proton antiporter NhaA [Helicobacter pullorum]KPH49785.1 pH-dependent sodium/proton antiporter [Helicobacter pullorum]KPH52495.1 pH-dependent sodium/proton antiporter [Helicobacter pullorum]OCR04379.1 Na+/H+ antiporter NhaA [Helicobacter pullorum]OCR05665.1 Na+/H+ antiporter NhaA [Helicobacter pullorum]OCR09673.1 Na+/H+ antiporter NhaA [Helicobacter pullorum]
METKSQNSLIAFFSKITKSESFAGILLLCCAVLAMIVANSPWGDSYAALWKTKFGFDVNGVFIGMSLEHWINDVLMAFFFLVVGLEIKREVLFGELAGFKRAALPIIAALGGMIGPGIIYFTLNAGTPSEHGFGIPMATDIAFALGVLSALGKRVSISVKVFLVSLAVADDLGAIIVIALFYSSGISFEWLAVAVGIVAVLVVLNKAGIKALTPYMILGVLLWIAVHNCGVHATIAAVVLAFTIPVAPKIDTLTFMEKIKTMIKDFQESEKQKDGILLQSEQVEALYHIAKHKNAVQNPLLRLEHALAPYSNYLIMPIFAFANAGVSIGSNIDFGIDHVFLGIFFGLVVGKPLGIFTFTFLAEKLGIAARPKGVTWVEIFGAGALGGIGFTMSMFVTNLAFSGEHALVATDVAKISILIASLSAGILGSIFFFVRDKVTHHH